MCCWRSWSCMPRSLGVSDQPAGLPSDQFGEIDPPDRRLLMGPGPSNLHLRVLRAMSAAVLATGR